MELSAVTGMLRADAGGRLVEGQAQRWRGAAVAGICAAVLIAVLVLDEVGRPVSSFGALTVIPVAIAAWLLSGWTAIAVVSLALGVRVVGVLLGGVDAVTATADIGTLLVIAVALSAARRYLIRWRLAQAALQADREAQAALAERQRIAAELPAHEIQVLFRLTLELQAAASEASDQAVRTRIAIVIEELDALIQSLRGVVYARDGSERPSDRVT